MKQRIKALLASGVVAFLVLVVAAPLSANGFLGGGATRAVPAGYSGATPAVLVSYGGTTPTVLAGYGGGTQPFPVPQRQLRSAVDTF